MASEEPRIEEIGNPYTDGMTDDEVVEAIHRLRKNAQKNTGLDELTNALMGGETNEHY